MPHFDSHDVALIQPFDFELNPIPVEADRVSTFRVAGKAADFNRAQIDETFTQAIDLTGELNDALLEEFTSTREELAPGIDEQIQRTRDFADDLQSFRLPRDLVFRLRSDFASDITRGGQGFGGLGSNSLVSAFGREAVDIALEGANLSRTLERDASGDALRLTNNPAELGLQLLGYTTLTPAAAVQSQQQNADRSLRADTFNAELDFRAQLEEAENNRFIADFNATAVDRAITRVHESILEGKRRKQDDPPAASGTVNVGGGGSTNDDPPPDDDFDEDDLGDPTIDLDDDQFEGDINEPTFDTGGGDEGFEDPTIGGPEEPEVAVA